MLSQFANGDDLLGQLGAPQLQLTSSAYLKKAGRARGILRLSATNQLG